MKSRALLSCLLIALGTISAFGQRHYSQTELFWLGAEGPSATMPTIGGAMRTTGSNDIFLDGQPIDVYTAFYGAINATNIHSLTVSRDGSIAGTAIGDDNGNLRPVYAFDIRPGFATLYYVGKVDYFQASDEIAASNYNGNLAMHDSTSFGSSRWDGIQIIDRDAPLYTNGIISSSGNTHIQDRFSLDGKLYFTVNKWDGDFGAYRNFSYMYDTAADSELDFSKKYGYMTSFVTGPDKRGYVGVSYSAQLEGSSNARFQVALFDGVEMHSIPELSETGWFSTWLTGITNEGEIFGYYQPTQGSNRLGFILSHGGIYRMSDYVSDPHGYLSFTGRFYDNGAIEVFDSHINRNNYLVPTVPETVENLE
jgi:hypothetical protein